ncbi:MAG: hypothetical protein D6782_02635 [Alphaproteobacteria bacterium]|nr:MAG: hypothetical protein D6782_02635 [Alphaproteobacteria bacterium]
MTLGEHGYVGLFLFLLLLTSSYFTCGHVVALARGQPELKWAEDLAKMLQVALIAYATAGAFLSLAKFDFYYHICAMTLILQRIVEARLATARALPQAVPGAMAAGSARPAA